jgi:hypothetical protein
MAWFVVMLGINIMSNNYSVGIINYAEIVVFFTNQITE